MHFSIHVHSNLGLKSVMNPSILDFKSPIQNSVSRLRFAPNSNNLLISSLDTSVRLYDAENFHVRFEVFSEFALLDCCFQSESVALAAGSDGSIRRYDLHSGNDDIIGNHEDSATCVECFHETSLAISAGWDKKLRLFDMRNNAAIRCLNTLVSGDVDSIALYGCTLMVATGSVITTYDLRTNKEPVQTKESSMDIRIKCVRPTITSQGFCAGYAVGSYDGRVALEYFDLSDSKTAGYAFRCYPKEKDGRLHLVTVNDIAFNPSGNGAFVTGDNDGHVIAWDALSKKRLTQLPRHPNSIGSLSYNYNGTLLAVASNCTYQEPNEKVELPQIFMHEMNDLLR